MMYLSGNPHKKKPLEPYQEGKRRDAEAHRRRGSFYTIEFID
jgi:hypothetical protein